MLSGLCPAATQIRTEGGLRQQGACDGYRTSAYSKIAKSFTEYGRETKYRLSGSTSPVRQDRIFRYAGAFRD
jgi:hypothetical protein